MNAPEDPEPEAIDLGSAATLPLFFDPRQAGFQVDDPRVSPDALALQVKARAAVVRDLATLHLLLFDRVAVQDNFLISKLLQETAGLGGPNSLHEWIRRGWVTVARRKSASSLTALKDQLLDRANASKYEPFEGYGRGIELYGESPFKTYVAELDNSLAASRLLSWDEDALAGLLRQRARLSAEDNSSGLTRERALAIWTGIDTENDGRHARTPYFNHAAKLPAEEALLVRRWISRLYLTNLPEALKASGTSIEISAPREALQSVGAHDPFGVHDAYWEVRDAAESADPEVLEGRNCALLSRAFLSKLNVEDLNDLRNSAEFRDLQVARWSGDVGQLNQALRQYLRMVGANGLRTIDPNITRLKFHARVVSFVTTLGMGFCVLLPDLRSAFALFSAALNLHGGSKAALALAEAAARRTAADQPLKPEMLELADFSHDQKDRPDGSQQR